MAPRLLFHLVLKILGIYFLKDIFISLPGFFGMFLTFAGPDPEGFGISTMITLVTFGSYVMVIYFLLFRTDGIIDKLKLIKGLDGEPVVLNIHRSTVLSIVILITGLLILIQAIPFLISGLIDYYQDLRLRRSFLDRAPFDFSVLVVNIAQILLGLLLIGNQRRIVSFIEWRRKK